MNGPVLVIGGGVAGLQAALECADAGLHATVVERGPVVGGHLAAAMTADSSSRGQVDGTPIPMLPALAGRQGLEIMTLARLEAIEGGPGGFVARIREDARLVTDSCTRCNRCKAVCPAVAPNEYDAGMSYRKAIYTPLPETQPSEYVIDLGSCLNQPPNYLPCQRCVEVCDDDAIHFEMPLTRHHERRVGAVIVATGFDVEEGEGLAGLGYGVHPDVVTSRELQRLLESPGPTGGFVARPSNEEYPESILFVLDVVSAFSAYVAARQLRRVADQGVERISLLVLEQRRARPELGELEAAVAESGADLVFGSLLGAEPSAAGKLDVRYVDLGSGRVGERECDMVVLFPPFKPPEGLAELAGILEIELDEGGYVAATGEGGARVVTSRPGVYAAGCATGPKSVADSIGEARAAARILGRRGAPVGETAGEGRGPDVLSRQRIEEILRSLMELGRS
jgi:heterodisulfide reductase subunit A